MATPAIRQGWLRLLGVFAHPDDEVFCAGGTLAQHAAIGAEIMVVSLTRGEAGQIRDARAATRRTLGHVREQELSHSCQQLGVQHALCLDYGDGRLQSVAPDILIGRITEIIRTFQPDVVITFGPDGGYGHPDHITVSAATAQAFRLAGNAKEFPEQIAAGLGPHHAARLYFSHFPRSRMLLADRLIKWLVELDKQFHGSVDFAHAVLLFAQESTMLGYSSDYFELAWFPSGFYLVEQGEPATKLYLILSGRVEVIQEKDDGTLHTLAQIEAGNFFGEAGLAYQQPHPAHIVAAENVTCLVFSPQEPTNFAGRGAEAQLRETTAVDLSQPQAHGGATTCIDVSDYVAQKIAAMAAHRTQFSLDPEMFSTSMLRDLFGQEYFVRIHPPIEMETDLFSVSDMLYSRQL